jgi:hypothetical protein
VVIFFLQTIFDMSEYVKILDFAIYTVGILAVLLQ